MTLTKFSTATALANGSIVTEDECAQCGRRLRDKPHAWASDRGNYCTKRCAEAHDDDMKYLEKSDS